MIDILIPTYNRCSEVVKNLDVLSGRIKKEGLRGKFRVLVSDNHSTDGTLNALAKKQESLPFEIIVSSQAENVGLEKNAIALLSQASADFVMYIGDDDFLPAGYLSYVVDRVENDPLLGAVVPGISSLYGDGSVKPSRTAKFEERQYPRGLCAVLKVSQYGHQLSGVLFRRDNLHENYTREPQLRNIYPFIYFLGYNNVRGNTYYAPKFDVLVSVSNAKDWAYDESGLLTEIFRNYKILFRGSRLKESICCLAFIYHQPWRLRIGRNSGASKASFFHLMRSMDVDVYVKTMLPLLYFYSYMRRVLARNARRLGLIG